MRLDFSALTQSTSRKRGQVGTTGTQASMRVAESPTAGAHWGTSGDTTRRVRSGLDSSAAVPVVCPPLSPPCPQSLETCKPSVHAVSPLSPAVPIESDNGAALPHAAMEARRQRVLAMLTERPGIKYAVVVDSPDADPMILAVAIRGVGTCELRISRAKYDGMQLLELIERRADPRMSKDACIT